MQDFAEEPLWREVSEKLHDMCRVPARTYSMHGGAGALISIGLFRQVPYEDVHKCIQQAYSSGGDGFITECLWEVGIDFRLTVGELAPATREASAWHESADAKAGAHKHHNCKN